MVSERICNPLSRALGVLGATWAPGRPSEFCTRPPSQNWANTQGKESHASCCKQRPAHALARIATAVCVQVHSLQGVYADALLRKFERASAISTFPPSPGPKETFARFVYFVLASVHDECNWPVFAQSRSNDQNAITDPPPDSTQQAVNRQTCPHTVAGRMQKRGFREAESSMARYEKSSRMASRSPRTPERITETNRRSRLVCRGHRPWVMPRSSVHRKLCDQFLLDASLSLRFFARGYGVPSYSFFGPSQSTSLASIRCGRCVGAWVLSHPLDMGLAGGSYAAWAL